MKFRFEKYRYLLTHLLCLQIFEVLLSDKHSTGPRNGRLVPLPVACLVWWYSFCPQIYDESKTDQILNAKYFVWNNYTLGKWGSRKAFNQNSLMQLFNGDRPIVHCTDDLPLAPSPPPKVDYERRSTMQNYDYNYIPNITCQQVCVIFSNSRNVRKMALLLMSSSRLWWW